VQTLAQSVLSTEFVQSLVQEITPDGPGDPTADAVAFAFTNASGYPQHPPSGDDWTAGSWDTYPGGQYWAQILVGPLGPASGGITLATGTWQAWLKITDNPAVPVRQPFLLQIV
jgi:hypothetical protein